MNIEFQLFSGKRCPVMLCSELPLTLEKEGSVYARE